MVIHGQQLAWELHSECAIVEALDIATYREQKERLARQQENEGREGEVWFRPAMLYTPDKNNEDIFVRTKYYVEFPALCVGFTPTTAAGHAFGAMTITDLQGNDLGNIGTGFTREEKQWLLHRFNQTGPFKVEIRSQRMSVYNKTRHGRFLRVVE